MDGQGLKLRSDLWCSILHDLLKALLMVFQTQRFTNGATLSWTSWKEACRRPSQLIQVISECSECGVPRAFVPRVLWSAPKSLPTWTCECFELECGKVTPEVITDLPSDVWSTLVNRDSKSLVSQPSQLSRMLLKHKHSSAASRIQSGNTGLPVEAAVRLPPTVSPVFPVPPRERQVKGLPKPSLSAEVITPADSISQVGVKDSSPMRGTAQELSYWNPARKHTWSQRQAKPWDPRAIPEVSRYIIGFPLQYFRGN